MSFELGSSAFRLYVEIHHHSFCKCSWGQYLVYYMLNGAFDYKKHPVFVSGLCAGLMMLVVFCFFSMCLVPYSCSPVVVLVGW